MQRRRIGRTPVLAPVRRCIANARMALSVFGSRTLHRIFASVRGKRRPGAKPQVNASAATIHRGRPPSIIACATSASPSCHTPMYPEPRRFEKMRRIVSGNDQRRSSAGGTRPAAVIQEPGIVRPPYRQPASSSPDGTQNPLILGHRSQQQRQRSALRHCSARAQIRPRSNRAPPIRSSARTNYERHSWRQNAKHR